MVVSSNKRRVLITVSRSDYKIMKMIAENERMTFSEWARIALLEKLEKSDFSKYRRINDLQTNLKKTENKC